MPPVTRPEPPFQADERATLTVWLDYQRATLMWKCDGLSGEDLARRGVPPSGLSLLGLVRHMTFVEWWWFDHIFAGSDAARPIATDDDDADFNDLRPERAEADFERFHQQCDVSRRVVSAADSLDQVAKAAHDTIALRWIMIHMVEEYARHNGHADLLRELIDGAVGE
jgi:Protein of unknown function (DUF664)